MIDHDSRKSCMGSQDMSLMHDNLGSQDVSRWEVRDTLWRSGLASCDQEQCPTTKE